jgi:hypothetical protein
MVAVQVAAGNMTTGRFDDQGVGSVGGDHGVGFARVQSRKRAARARLGGVGGGNGCATGRKKFAMFKIKWVLGPCHFDQDGRRDRMTL